MAKVKHTSAVANILWRPSAAAGLYIGSIFARWHHRRYFAGHVLRRLRDCWLLFRQLFSEVAAQASFRRACTSHIFIVNLLRDSIIGIRWVCTSPALFANWWPFSRNFSCEVASKAACRRAFTSQTRYRYFSCEVASGFRWVCTSPAYLATACLFIGTCFARWHRLPLGMYLTVILRKCWTL